MGLLALQHHPCAKGPGWRFLGSQEVLSQQQLSLPASSITARMDPPDWALPLLTPFCRSTGSWCHQLAVSPMESLCWVSAWLCPDSGGLRSL